MLHFNKLSKSITSLKNIQQSESFPDSESSVTVFEQKLSLMDNKLSEMTAIFSILHSSFRKTKKELVKLRKKNQYLSLSIDDLRSEISSYKKIIQYMLQISCGIKISSTCKTANDICEVLVSEFINRNANPSIPLYCDTDDIFDII